MAVELEDCAKRAVGGPGGLAGGSDDGLGLGADGADAVGQVAAAKVAGAAADFVGNGAHVGRGVEGIEDEVGILGGFEVEGGADKGAGGAEDFEKGAHDGWRTPDYVAEAAERAMDHEDVTWAYAEATQVRGEAVAGEDHRWRVDTEGRARIRRQRRGG